MATGTLSCLRKGYLFSVDNLGQQAKLKATSVSALFVAAMLEDTTTYYCFK